MAPQHKIADIPNYDNNTHNFPVVSERWCKENQMITGSHEARCKNYIKDKRQEALRADLIKISNGRAVHKPNRHSKICRQFQIFKLTYIPIVGF